MTRIFRTLLLLPLLAACQPPEPVAGLRNPSIPIRSLAIFEQSSLSGTWSEVEGHPLRSGCVAGALVFAPDGLATDGTGCFLPLAGRTALTVTGPGRFTGRGREFWVLWADADRRTAVIGTPDGSFAAVLNRDPVIPEDRLVAARRVLEFNGYDTSRLVGR